MNITYILIIFVSKCVVGIHVHIPICYIYISILLSHSLPTHHSIPSPLQAIEFSHGDT